MQTATQYNSLKRSTPRTLRAFTNKIREVCLKRKEKQRRELSNEGDYSHDKSGDKCRESDKEESSVEDRDSSGAVDIPGRQDDYLELENSVFFLESGSDIEEVMKKKKKKPPTKN
ncbi:unnamed protein product [Lepeophtheirus salmonis]|uniref:(salmon louse) hypothetical protein n=1 Tax=Lepeophtheirus salmonis TaxID=72036 RepID=A0A7R8H832_LEPSM|nr:unnamed protein product [Lepeophtheirus salmonis]CAF2915339.1 unnamed protein product [Lepeophtheirus salmonis]